MHDRFGKERRTSAQFIDGEESCFDFESIMRVKTVSNAISKKEEARCEEE
jgi:hypothetical protein